MTMPPGPTPDQILQYLEAAVVKLVQKIRVEEAKLEAYDKAVSATSHSHEAGIYRALAEEARLNVANYNEEHEGLGREIEQIKATIARSNSSILVPPVMPFLRKPGRS